MIVAADLTTAEADDLRRYLDEHNEPIVGSPRVRDIRLALRDGAGELVGGLIGAISWQWFHINVIWVSPHLRGTGEGSRLLLDAEDTARSQGAEYVQLHTFSFQARPFYERHGYTVLVEKPDFPKGHSQFLMFKRLDE